MKTKSYKMFVSKEFIGIMNKNGYNNLNCEKKDHLDTPITITIEVPEPTVTITPSGLMRKLPDEWGMDKERFIDVVFGEGWDNE